MLPKSDSKNTKTDYVEDISHNNETYGDPHVKASKAYGTRMKAYALFWNKTFLSKK